MGVYGQPGPGKEVFVSEWTNVEKNTDCKRKIGQIDKQQAAAAATD